MKSLLGTSEGSSCGGLIEHNLSIVDGLSESLLGSGESSSSEEGVLGGIIDDVGDLLKGLLGCGSNSVGKSSNKG